MRLYAALLSVLLGDAEASSASVPLLATDHDLRLRPSLTPPSYIHAGYCLGCTRWPAATGSPGIAGKFSAFVDSARSRRCVRGGEHASLRAEIDSVRAELDSLARQLDEVRRQRDDLLLEDPVERSSCEEPVTTVMCDVILSASSSRDVCMDDERPLTSRDDFGLRRLQPPPFSAPGLMMRGEDSIESDDSIVERNLLPVGDGGHEYGVMASVALTLLALALAMSCNKLRGAPTVGSANEIKAKDDLNLEIEVSDINEDEVSTIGTFTSPRTSQPELNRNVFKRRASMTAIDKKNRARMLKRADSAAATKREKINVLERLFPFLKPRAKLDAEEVSVMHCGNGIYEW